MSAISKLFNNPAIKKLFLKQFKEIVEKEGLKFIGIKIIEGEQQVDFYTKEMIAVEKEGN